MKRIFALLLCLTLMFCAIFPAAGIAETGDASIIMSISASPAKLSDTGDVIFTITVKNTGVLDVHDVEAILPGVRGTLEITEPATKDSAAEILGAGHSKKKSIELTIKKSEIGKKLLFVVNGYAEPRAGQSGSSQRVQAGGSIVIKNGATPTAKPTAKPTSGKPAIEGSVSFATKVAPKNAELDYTVKIKNSGPVDITNVKVTMNDKQVNKVFDLAAGKTHNVNNDLKLEKDTTIKTVVSYDYSGKTYTKELKDVELHVADAGITVAATAETQTPSVGATDKITVTIKNAGTADLKDICLYDYMNNAVTLPQTTLAQGSSMTLDINEVFSMDTELAYSVTAKDASGNSIDAVSPTISIKPAIDPSSIKLSMTAAPETLALPAPGMASFDITVKNEGTIDLSLGQVSEDSLGVFGTFNTLAAGESATFKASVNIDAAKTLTFKTTAEDINGGAHETTVTASVTIGDAPAPSATPAPAPADGGIPWLWIIVGVVIVVLVVLLVITMKKKSK